MKYVQTLTLPTLDSQALHNEHSLWWNPAGMLPGNWPLHPPFPVRCEGYMQVRLRRDSCSDTLRWAERSLCDLVLASSDISDISEAFIGVQCVSLAYHFSSSGFNVCQDWVLLVVGYSLCFKSLILNRCVLQSQAICFCWIWGSQRLHQRQRGLQETNNNRGVYSKGEFVFRLQFGVVLQICVYSI